MKAINLIFFIAVMLLASITKGQQYKLRQVTTTSGMKTESTVYVKKSRKRTESSGYNGMRVPVSVEQCDSQRTIYINDKKKLYYIDKWNNIIEQPTPEPKTKAKTASPAKQAMTINGGVVHNWYSITDTGERKKMFGFTARHVWTSQRIVPSATACMKDSMKMKSDGWYIDLPQFSCTTVGHGSGGYGGNGGGAECRDQFITHQSGKGKLGFPLVEVKTFIMGNGNEFESRIETIELSTAKLDSMLFEIPPGYKEAASMSELQEMNVGELIRAKRNDGDEQETNRPIVTEEKPAGTTRIGVFVPHAAEELETSALQEKLVNALFSDGVDAVAIQSTADATRFHCDYVLNTDFIKIKAGSKMGGILKAIRSADPGASSTYNIELSWTLLDVNGGAAKAKDDLSGKFEGKIDEAAARALEKTAVKVRKSI